MKLKLTEEQIKEVEDLKKLRQEIYSKHNYLMKRLGKIVGTDQWHNWNDWRLNRAGEPFDKFDSLMYELLEDLCETQQK